MDESEIKQKLEMLAEFEAQRTLLGMDKNALLEEVKVPEEVQAIVNAGMKKFSEVERQFIPAMQVIEATYEARLAEIAVPEEIRVALAKIDLERGLASANRKAQENEIHERAQALKDSIHMEVEAATADVYKAIATRKAEIEAEFRDKELAVDDNIRKLTEEVKGAVKEIGFTVKSEHYTASFVKGKKSWIPDRLEKYTEDHPDIRGCYTVGDPSVTLRKV